MMKNDIELSVSEFVALLNQTLEYAYSGVVITGELANLRVSKNRWLYFDLKDEECTVKFFGTVYQLPGPLEDGMLLKVRGTPRLHNVYGFSVNVASIQPAGEGSIKRAAELLKTKLLAEGLFDEVRKRVLPYPPQRIGLIASKQSAAYADFIKIINARWQGLSIELIDVQVQGESAPPQITAALEQFNAESQPPEVIVIIRGGGSAEDLAAFNSEALTRAIAASRVPTLVAIGHEIDLSLAELAADRRASTPSNAAEVLVPDRGQILKTLATCRQDLEQDLRRQLQVGASQLDNYLKLLHDSALINMNQAQTSLKSQAQLLNALNPAAVLRRGYAIVRQQGRAVRSVQKLAGGQLVDVQLVDGTFSATIDKLAKAKS